MSMIPVLLTLFVAGMCGLLFFLLIRSIPATMKEYGFSDKELSIW